MLLEMTVELQGFSRRLENMVEALPSSPQGDAELDDVVLELRNVISNVNHECVRRAIVDLRDAAYYPAEPADSAEPAP
jgi:hypothetical protein